MSLSATQSRYGTVQILLHWLIAALFATNFLISDDMGRALRIKLQGGVPDQFAALVHPPVGVAILALMVLRIGLRWWLGAPALPAGPALMNRLAHWGHLALYAVLLAVPLSGMAAWGAGIAGAGDVHEIMVNLALLLVAGHVGAALFHQFVLKDNLMARMRPGGNTR